MTDDETSSLHKPSPPTIEEKMILENQNAIMVALLSIPSIKTNARVSSNLYFHSAKTQTYVRIKEKEK